MRSLGELCHGDTWRKGLHGGVAYWLRSRLLTINGFPQTNRGRQLLAFTGERDAGDRTETSCSYYNHGNSGTELIELVPELQYKPVRRCDGCRETSQQ